LTARPQQARPASGTAALRKLGRPTLRASLDDFKHPWPHAREHGYDRLTGEGYYRNAFDFASARNLLLRPAGPDGSGQVVLCAHDPLTGAEHRDQVIAAPPGSVLIVDGMFAFRPQYNDCWEFRILLAVDPEQALRRGVSRDAESEGADEAARVHRDRYQTATHLYEAEVEPAGLADLIIDNNDIQQPRILTARAG
jgi:uridine kinase